MVVILKKNKKWSDRWILREAKKLGLKVCFVKLGDKGNGL